VCPNRILKHLLQQRSADQNGGPVLMFFALDTELKPTNDRPDVADIQTLT
jgi:hypothetical protein